MTADPTADLRRAFYLLLTTLGVAVCVAKIAGAENVFEPSRYRPPTDTSYGADRVAAPQRPWPATRPEPTPTFGSNDRSRFSTVKALVEDGTYVVGRRENFRSATDYRDRGVVFDDGYQSLDKVMDPDTGAFYSSKPPLFPTLVAAEYWLLHRVVGLSIDRDRWWVVGVILLTFNALPFAVSLRLLAVLIDHHGRTDFGRLFAFTFAATATFVTTFSATLNNHTPAACCVVLALYPLLRPGAADTRGALFTSGFFAGLLTTLELPALSLAVGLILPLAVARRARSLWYAAGLSLPVAALFAANYAAMGRWLPAYGEFGGPWYDFAGSHWAKLKLAGPKVGLGIDFADEPKAVYAFHLTLGHHGWFSLTPAWLLGLVGLVSQARKAINLDKVPSGVWTLDRLAVLTLTVSAVVFSFYTVRTNNYGGFCCCARWLIWLTPLWTLGLLAGADAVSQSRRGRVVAGLMLAASAFSVAYPAWNPWRPPWILQLCELMGWVRY